MWTQLPKYRKLSSSLSSSSFWQHSQLKCPRLVSVNVQEAMKTPYYTVSALALLLPVPWSLVRGPWSVVLGGPSTTKNHPKETKSANQMQVLLIQPSVRLHLRVNNAKCAEHFCILKHTLERTTPHCPRPLGRSHCMRCNLKHKTRHTKSLSELATLAFGLWLWVKNALRLFYSTLNVIFFYFYLFYIPFLVFFLFEKFETLQIFVAKKATQSVWTSWRQIMRNFKPKRQLYHLKHIPLDHPLLLLLSLALSFIYFFNIDLKKK